MKIKIQHILGTLLLSTHQVLCHLICTIEKFLRIKKIPFVQ